MKNATQPLRQEGKLHGLVLSTDWPFEGRKQDDFGRAPGARSPVGYDDSPLRRRMDLFERRLAEIATAPGGRPGGQPSENPDLTALYAAVEKLANVAVDQREALRVLTLGVWAARARDLNDRDALAMFNHDSNAIEDALAASYAMERRLVGGAA